VAAGANQLCVSREYAVFQRNIGIFACGLHGVHGIFRRLAQSTPKKERGTVRKPETDFAGIDCIRILRITGDCGRRNHFGLYSFHRFDTATRDFLLHHHGARDYLYRQRGELHRRNRRTLRFGYGSLLLCIYGDLRTSYAA
jgi:hypothetical protein